MAAVFDDFAQLPMQAFNRMGRIKHFPDFKRIGEEGMTCSHLRCGDFCTFASNGSIRSSENILSGYFLSAVRFFISIMSIPFGFHLLMTSTHKIHDRLVSSAQSTVQVTLCTAIRNGKIGGGEARSTYPISANLIQLWLSQYDRANRMLKKRLPQRSRNTKPKSQHWSAKPGNSRWRSTCSKRCHGCDPKAAARPHPSSAARCLFSPMGVSDDSAPTEHFFIVLSRKRLV